MTSDALHDLVTDDVSFPLDIERSLDRVNSEVDPDFTRGWLRLQAPQHRAQARIAYEFAADNQCKLMHVAEIGWFSYTGERWVEDTGAKAAMNAVFETIRRLAPKAVGDKELSLDLLRAQSAPGVKGVLDLAAAMPGIAVRADDLDADPYLLNTPAGTVNLRTFDVLEHDPLHRLTKITRGSYDEFASCAMWEAFLERVLPDPAVRSYLQRFMGVALVGEQLEHVLLIATGEGRNGKGVTYETLGHSLGTYAHFAPSTLFEKTKGNANAATPALFGLRGARFVALSETEKTARIAAALLKSLTGGDPVTARSLYGSPITFSASWLIMLITNHLPVLPADDPAVWERVRVAPFDVVIPKPERDPHLKRKLRAEADGILTWMLKGLQEYWIHGLNEPAAVSAATNSYASKQDNVARFIEAMCTTTPSNGGNTTKELHDAYKEWAIADGIFREHQLGRTDFGYSLDKLGYPAVKKSRGMVREGLGLLTSGGVPVSGVPDRAASGSTAASGSREHSVDNRATPRADDPWDIPPRGHPAVYEG